MPKRVIIIAGNPGRRVDDGTLLKCDANNGLLGTSIADAILARSDNAGQACRICYVAPKASVKPCNPRVTCLTAETDEEATRLLEDLLTGNEDASGEPIDTVIDASAVPLYRIDTLKDDPFPRRINRTDRLEAPAVLVQAPAVASRVKAASPGTFLVTSVPACYASRPTYGDAAEDVLYRTSADAAFVVRKPDDHRKSALAIRNGPGGTVAQTYPDDIATAVADLIFGENT